MKYIYIVNFIRVIIRDRKQLNLPKSPQGKIGKPCFSTKIKKSNQYHSAQIKWAIIQMEFSLSSRTRKTKIMTPFKAPGNFLQIVSNRRSVALFVQELRYFKVRITKDERRKGSEKRFIQSPSEMNNNAQDDLPLLKSTKNGENYKSITCLWNQQNDGP